jgi:hypothetical protein
MSRRSRVVTERPALHTLVGVELTRFRSRRAILLLVAAAIVLSGLFAAKLAWDTRPITPEDLATAKAQAAINAKDRQVQADLKACRERPEEYIGAGGTAEQCAETILPRAESYLARGPLVVDDVLPGHGIAVAILLVVLMILAGTTFAGADWASGSMSNQLLFESQRSRIWTAKALALGLGVLVVTALGLLAFWVPVRLVALQRDIAVGGDLQADVGWHLVRTLVLAVVGAVLAYGLTMLFRHTVATVALLFGASVAAEILLSLLPFSGSGRISPSHNAFAWLQGETQYYDSTITCSGAGGCDQVRTLEMWPAGLLIGVVFVVVMVVSLMSFRRRDLP